MEYIGIGLLAVALRFWGNNTQLQDTPDSRAYTAMCRGVPVRNPFRLRWLLPKLLPDNSWIWWGVSSSALVLTCPLLAMFAEAHGVPGVWAVMYCPESPGIRRAVDLESVAAAGAGAGSGRAIRAVEGRAAKK